MGNVTGKNLNPGDLFVIPNTVNSIQISNKGSVPSNFKSVSTYDIMIMDQENLVGCSIARNNPRS